VYLSVSCVLFALDISMPKEIRQAHHRRTSSAQAASASMAMGGPASARASATTWSAADDDILMRARASGLNWQPIASKHFPNKTANACRKRHERLMERQKIGDWDGGKLELLATEYHNVREEMWKVLADRVGEKWRIVEEKVSWRPLSLEESAMLTGVAVHGKGPEEPPASVQVGPTQGARYGR
jgi:hypothetical protein